MKKFISIVVTVLVLTLTGLLMTAYTTNPVFASTADAVAMNIIYADPATMTNEALDKEAEDMSVAGGSYYMGQLRWTAVLKERLERGLVKKTGITLDPSKLIGHVLDYPVQYTEMKRFDHGWQLSFVHPKTGELTVAKLSNKPATAGGTAFLSFIDTPTSVHPEGTWVVDSKKIPSTATLEKAPKDMTADEIAALKSKATT